MKKIKNFFKHYCRNEEGSTAVEFALISLGFLIVLFGVAESGRMVWTMNGVQYVVEETSRYASLNSSLNTSQLQSYAEAKMSQMFLPANPLQITSRVFTSNGINFIEVDADYDHTTLLNGFIPGEFGELTFESTSSKPVIN